MSPNQVDSLLVSPYVRTLRLIATRLKDSGINWVLTGSLAFALQGISLTPHDIDLQTDQAGAYAIEQLLLEFVTRPVSFSLTVNIRSHFGVLTIDGIKVEIMGDIQKRPAGGDWEEPVDLTRHKRLLYIEEMSIPVLSLEYEYQAYLTMGRSEQAQLIQQAIQNEQASP